MSKRLKIGAIGWLMAFDNEYGKTTAVCDIRKEKLDGFLSKRPGVQGYTDYRKMADEAGLDAVIISTPNWLHREMAECFMRAGVDVFLEKPMGVNKEQIDSVVRVQRETGKVCAIDFEMRICKGMGRVREIIASGEIGEFNGLEFIHHRGGWEARGNGVWRTQPEKSGGLFFMEICHEIDMCRCLGGEITHVQSFRQKNVLPQYPDNMPDNVCTHIWFEGGQFGTLLAGHTSSTFDAPPELYDELGHDMYWVITGTQGAIRFEEAKQKILVMRYADFHPDAPVGKHVEFVRLEDYTSVKNLNHDIRGNQLAFLSCCAEGKPFHQDTLDAWKTHVACLAAEKSAIEDFQKIEIDYALPAGVSE